MSLLQDHRFIPKLSQFLKKPSSLPQITPTHLSNPRKKHSATQRTSPFSKISSTHVPIPLKFPCFHGNLQTHLGLCFPISVISLPFPSLASETVQSSEKINVEAIVNSIDNFFNRNPFFVAGLTFVWLVVIPLAQAYLRKYKSISAIDAFQKLREISEAQLLDIRKEKTVKYMGSPNLKILNKSTVWVEYEQGKEEGFLKQVLRNFTDPESTVLCVLDNFDGDSMKVAELLYKNGKFKEVYAIEGGIRGKDGWQAIQETYLPPSVHVFPRKKKNDESAQLEVNGERKDIENKDNTQTLASSITNLDQSSNENSNLKSTEIDIGVKSAHERPSSPYPNYHDLQPPSSPTPSKP